VGRINSLIGTAGSGNLERVGTAGSSISLGSPRSQVCLEREDLDESGKGASDPPTGPQPSPINAAASGMLKVEPPLSPQAASPLSPQAASRTTGRGEGTRLDKGGDGEGRPDDGGDGVGEGKSRGVMSQPPSSIWNSVFGSGDGWWGGSTNGGAKAIGEAVEQTEDSTGKAALPSRIRNLAAIEKPCNWSSGPQIVMPPGTKGRAVVYAPQSPSFLVSSRCALLPGGYLPTARGASAEGELDLEITRYDLSSPSRQPSTEPPALHRSTDRSRLKDALQKLLRWSAGGIEVPSRSVPLRGTRNHSERGPVAEATVRGGVREGSSLEPEEVPNASNLARGNNAGVAPTSSNAGNSPGGGPRVPRSAGRTSDKTAGSSAALARELEELAAAQKHHLTSLDDDRARAVMGRPEDDDDGGGVGEGIDGEGGGGSLPGPPSGPPKRLSARCRVGACLSVWCRC